MSTDIETLGAPLRELRSRFEAEVEPHRQALWKYCLRLTGSAWDAEDLVQDVMERALAGLAKLWQPVHPKAYLFRMATNAWIDHWRRDVRVELQELAAADVIEMPNEAEARVDVHEAIELLVRSLPPLQRVAFLLCETLDFKAREAASLLNTTEGAVKAALHRARTSLAARASGARAIGANASDASASTRLLKNDRVDAVVRRYIDAFDARDADAIAALLHEDAVTNIVGSAVEIGREVSHRNSLADWASEPVHQWARAGILEDRNVVFVFAESDTGEHALYSLIELDLANDGVLGQNIYYFSPDLLAYAAAALQVAVMTHGYQYVAG